MGNTVECTRCRKHLIQEEFDTHDCASPLKAVKEIPIDFFFEARTTGNRLVLIANGLDGTLYRLVQSEKRRSVELDHTNMNTPNKHTRNQQCSEVYTV